MPFPLRRYQYKEEKGNTCDHLGLVSLMTFAKIKQLHNHYCLTEANLLLILWGQLCICAIQSAFCISGLPSSIILNIYH